MVELLLIQYGQLPLSKHGQLPIDKQSLHVHYELQPHLMYFHGQTTFPWMKTVFVH